MKSIREFADEIGVSRQSVYKKIKELGLSTMLTKVDNRLTLSLQQEQLLVSAYKLVLEDEVVNQYDNTVNHVDSKLTDYLLDQIKIKDEQISQLQRLLDQEQQLHQSTHKKLDNYLMIEANLERNIERKKESTPEEKSLRKPFWKFWM